MTKPILRTLYFILAISWLTSCKKDSHSHEEPIPVIQEPVTQPKSILMVVTSNNRLKDGSSAGYFLPEAVDFYKELRKAGYNIVIASPKGGKAPMYERASYINSYRRYLDTSGLLNMLDSTKALASIKVEDYKAVFYVGGFACLFDFPDNADIKRITQGIYESGGVVAAVCHAPAALLNVPLANGKLFIENKKLTSRTIDEETGNGQGSVDDVLFYFPFILEDALKSKGALYSHAGIGQIHVVTDGRLVTGQNPESSTKVAETAIKLIPN